MMKKTNRKGNLKLPLHLTLTSSNLEIKGRIKVEVEGHIQLINHIEEMETMILLVREVGTRADNNSSSIVAAEGVETTTSVATGDLTIKAAEVGNAEEPVIRNTTAIKSSDSREFIYTFTVNSNIPVYLRSFSLFMS